jgi:hypothetical protein
MLFVASHAVQRFVERIAPYLSYEEAKAIILEDVKTITLESIKRAKSNYYVRIRSNFCGKDGTPYKYRMFIARQEKTPERGYMVVTVHRG